MGHSQNKPYRGYSDIGSGMGMPGSGYGGGLGGGYIGNSGMKMGQNYEEDFISGGGLGKSNYSMGGPVNPRQ